jgi:hypothetical protein
MDDSPLSVACATRELVPAGLGLEEVLIAHRGPWQNPYVERLIGTILPTTAIGRCLIDPVTVTSLQLQWQVGRATSHGPLRRPDFVGELPR